MYDVHSPEGAQRTHLTPMHGASQALGAGGSGAVPAGDVQFAESSDSWSAVPAWVRWFLQLGYDWHPASGTRRICIVSVPCDSPGAALVACGMMRRRLCVSDAGDLADHLAHLGRLFTTARASTLLRRPANRKRFRFIDRGADGSLRVSPEGRPDERHTIVEAFAFDWCVDGEPHPVAPKGRPLSLPLALMDRLVPEACSIIPENLARTDSAICLAGPVAGESRAEEQLSRVRFRLGAEEHALGLLLTVHGWHAGAVSRMTYYNGRTGTLDREVRAPLAVCVDGGQSFLNVLDDRRFRESDVVAVVARTSEPELLERVAQRSASLSQWYARDPKVGAYVKVAPPGLATVALVRE